MTARRVLFVTGMILAAGCAMSSDHTISATLDNNFQLQVGQSALVSPEKLRVGILAVTNDSRCGKGEVCVWEGEAIVQIWLQLEGESKQELELRTGSRGPNAAEHAGYGIVAISLHPEPVSGRSIAQADYIVTLQVRRGGVGDTSIY